jgi:hypothetical protein
VTIASECLDVTNILKDMDDMLVSGHICFIRVASHTPSFVGCLDVAAVDRRD